MKEPVTENIPDRRAFCERVLERAFKKVEAITMGICGAIRNDSVKRYEAIREGVVGAVQKYAFYRTGVVKISPSEVLQEFGEIKYVDLALSKKVVRKIEMAVNNAVKKELGAMR